ncbi:unnamed protein product [Cylicocyclus nassatus]|uniref:Uncharacterized protein n=1 Tax=Cylicocyclus nassatus TaxID=53992 RepID=A0AA36DLN8_CYLNA|nr:unnamed protein product [Cylicocyclus nassatus]
MDFQTHGSSSDFSSIARRLLLHPEESENASLINATDLITGKNSCSSTPTLVQLLSQPSTSTANGPNNIAVVQFNANDLMPCPAVFNANDLMPCPAVNTVEIERHTCPLCDGIRSLTPERLRAPLEKPPTASSYSRSKRYDGKGYSHLGIETEMVIRNVRRFFDTFKEELRGGNKGTLFCKSSVLTMLATGVSERTILRIARHHTSNYVPRRICKPRSGTMSQEEVFLKYGEEWGTVVFYFYVGVFLNSVNMDHQMHARPVNNFSLIARRLLLHQDVSDKASSVSAIELINEQQPSTSSTDVDVHIQQVNANNLVPIAEAVKVEVHSCPLCDALKGLTSERLKAPIEKPSESPSPASSLYDKYSAQGRSIHQGTDTEIIIRNVRRFFETFKKELKSASKGTLLNQPNVMTTLACGLSSKTVMRMTRRHNEPYVPKKDKLNKDAKRKPRKVGD